jgi:uncharacterized protein (DUF427 family)
VHHPIENVRDYPRPPRLERCDYPIQIVLGGVQIVETQDALRVLETFHPPTYYISPSAFLPGTVFEASGASHCEWKGRARYVSLLAGGKTAERCGWAYDRPTPDFTSIAGHIAVYCHMMDACFVDGERATPQPGNFYGGWVNSWIIGPIKGAPGTTHW